jgi:HEPN domain-containing protein
MSTTPYNERMAREHLEKAKIIIEFIRDRLGST